MAPRDIIIDCDPGQDDAVALLLALANPDKLNVLGVTTVAGNVPITLTYLNGRKVVELSGRTDVPVFRGCQRPLVGHLITAEEVHGATGLDGTDLPDPTLPEQHRHAVDFIIETLRAADYDSVTLVPVGPATNLATAFAMAPEILPKIRELVVMGGAYWEGGNTSPVAEFNVLVDPEAAKAMFACGRPITVMSLDVTHKALSTKARREAIARVGTRSAGQVHAMLNFYNRYDSTKYGMDGGPVHDACTIAYLLKPELFEAKHVHVDVECAGTLSRGQTVVDWWGVTGKPKNAHWVHKVDDDGFFQLVNEALARLP
ncbi:MAG: nucleoside hydrolase [Alphaproteobacteria bacterium]